jgi:hypothetical protein
MQWSFFAGGWGRVLLCDNTLLSKVGALIFAVDSNHLESFLLLSFPYIKFVRKMTHSIYNLGYSGLLIVLFWKTKEFSRTLQYTTVGQITA